MASFYGPTSPNGANEGDEWTNSTTNERRVFAGGTWRPVTPGGSGPTIETRTPVGDTVAGAETYTPAMLVGGLLLRDPNGAGRSDVTPTAAEIAAAVPGARRNTVFECLVVNTADAAETITLTVGNGVTLIPAAVTIAQNEIARLTVRIVNATPGAEQVIIYCMVAGG